jgi:hypothetical protein
MNSTAQPKKQRFSDEERYPEKEKAQFYNGGRY